MPWLISVYMWQALRQKYIFPYTFYGVLRLYVYVMAYQCIYVASITSQVHISLYFYGVLRLYVYAMAYQCIYVTSITSQVHISLFFYGVLRLYVYAMAYQCIYVTNITSQVHISVYFLRCVAPVCICHGLSVYICNKYYVTSTYFHILLRCGYVLYVSSVDYQCIYVASITSQVHFSIYFLRRVYSLYVYSVDYQHVCRKYCVTSTHFRSAFTI